MNRKAYPSDVSDDEWAFVAPYLTLMKEDAPQREHPLRDVFNGLRYVVRTGVQWRFLPNDLPPWYTVYQQTQRWIQASVFEDLVHDLRMLLREIAGRAPQPSAAILDSRTLQSTPESGARAGYDGHKKRKGSKVHLAVDTLGQLLAVLVTPANEQDRAQVAALAEQIQEVTGQSGGSGVRRSRLYRSATGRGGGATRHPARSGQTAHRQARLRALAPALGRRTQLRLDGPLPPVGPRLRALG